METLTIFYAVYVIFAAFVVVTTIVQGVRGELFK